MERLGLRPNGDAPISTAAHGNQHDQHHSNGGKGPPIANGMLRFFNGGPSRGETTSNGDNARGGQRQRVPPPRPNKPEELRAQPRTATRNHLSYFRGSGGRYSLTTEGVEPGGSLDLSNHYDAHESLAERFASEDFTATC
ncbi:hypothetical protein NW755_014182 [Fusarium falciforme]|uniref:Uncharacterized protein n=1 Tax=Fusarium falciforme TaxID=195108 RepID=A0A9W8QUG9_9HYPO|nr:hypothetical protein NW755_014182 [Fusarium falciforme]